MRNRSGTRATSIATIAIAAVAIAGVALACVGCIRQAQARFELQPGVASACDLPVATSIAWDVRPLGLKRVRVEVNNLGQRPKLWYVGPATGTQRAGAWAHDGYTVTFKAMNGVVLARRTLTTTPCLRKGGKRPAA